MKTTKRIIITAVLLLTANFLLLTTAFAQFNLLWNQTNNPSTGNEHAHAITADTSGIYVAGCDYTPGNWQWRIEKRNLTTGVLIASFGTAGVVIENLSAEGDIAYAITADASGIYVAGTDEIPGDNQWRIEKHLTTGALIASFGTAGVVESALSPSGTNSTYAITADASGIYVAGYDEVAGLGNAQWRIEKYDGCITSTLTVITSQTNAVCNNQCTGTATVTPTSGTTPYTYLWSNTQSTNTITGLCAGTYSVLVTDASGSTATANVTITQPPVITASTTATPAACGSNNGTAAVAATGGTPSYTYSWSNGNTTSALGGLAVGSYSILITDANSCTQTATVAVTQSGGPTAVAGTTATILSGNSASLNASGGATYSWSPSTGLNCITCANPVASPTVTIEYCVYVFDTAGCFDSACVTVFVVEPLNCAGAGELFVPNAFSPNGDGENDVLKIYYGDMRCIETFKLVIYNRWGEKVFSATDPSKAWDGMYRGKYENAAVFVYYLEATLQNGNEIVRKGNVSLIK